MRVTGNISPISGRYWLCARRANGDRDERVRVDYRRARGFDRVVPMKQIRLFPHARADMSFRCNTSTHSNEDDTSITMREKGLTGCTTHSQRTFQPRTPRGAHLYSVSPILKGGGSLRMPTNRMYAVSDI